jgi:hypothetical protein
MARGALHPVRHFCFVKKSPELQEALDRQFRNNYQLGTYGSVQFSPKLSRQVCVPRRFGGGLLFPKGGAFVDHLIVKDLIAQGVDVGIKVLGAIVVWIVGSWLIRFTSNMLTRSLADKKVDETLVK